MGKKLQLTFVIVMVCLHAFIISSCGPLNPDNSEKVSETGKKPDIEPSIEPALEKETELANVRADIKFCNLDWIRSSTCKYGKGEGWHLNNDGTILIGAQKTGYQGGILFLEKQYQNFDLSFEIKADKPTDGGIYLRSDLVGNGYQVRIDYWSSNGNIGGIYPDANGLSFSDLQNDPNSNGKDWNKYWKANDWNKIEARISGSKAYIEVWINDNKIINWTDKGTHNKGKYVGLQVHNGNEQAHWGDGKIQQYRNFKIKDLDTHVIVDLK